MRAQEGNCQDNLKVHDVPLYEDFKRGVAGQFEDAISWWGRKREIVTTIRKCRMSHCTKILNAES